MVHTFATKVASKDAKAYSELSQTSKMEFFAKIFNDIKPSIIFGKSFIFAV